MANKENINWKPFPNQSSNLAKWDYNVETKVLYIQFVGNNGTGGYKYLDVEQGVVDMLLEADSHGSFFYKNIRTVYTTEKL